MGETRERAKTMTDKLLPATKSQYVDLIKRFPTYAALSKRLIMEARLTKKQKITIGAGLGYLASPIDLIPGFIPVLGQLDDVLVVLLCIRRVLRDFDQDTADELLAAEGLTREQIDDDIVLVKETMKTIARKTATTVLNGLSSVGRAALGKIKSLTQ
ncbi:MAG TPA: DUF1232 domain-containing protein [Actinobacteria bacterium]|nr:DUF1232 domain-containing protein [Actinomycetota bacterium]